ncbi:MAG: hypothetical protein DRJ42_02365 [Deltaproteobacteria bacterium]|nr:MAG: hypothetical protein DRJ42_02365 [Deltaproteobacteria bacterium]
MVEGHFTGVGRFVAGLSGAPRAVVAGHGLPGQAADLVGSRVRAVAMLFAIAEEPVVAVRVVHAPRSNAPEGRVAELSRGAERVGTRVHARARDAGVDGAGDAVIAAPDADDARVGPAVTRGAVRAGVQAPRIGPAGVVGGVGRGVPVPAVFGSNGAPVVAAEAPLVRVDEGTTTRRGQDEQDEQDEGGERCF